MGCKSRIIYITLLVLAVVCFEYGRRVFLSAHLLAIPVALHRSAYQAPQHRMDSRSPMNTSSSRALGSMCDTWGCRVDHGLTSRGSPFIRMANVCVRKRSIAFLPFASEAESLRSQMAHCCAHKSQKALAPPLTDEYCEASRHRDPLCSNLLLYDMKLLVHDNATVSNPPSPLLPGRTYLLDTAIVGWYQFGHSFTKFVQLAVSDQVFNTIVINRMGRLPGGLHHGMWENHSRTIFDMTVAQQGVPIVLTGDGETCATELWTFPYYERAISSRASGDEWRSLIRRVGLSNNARCPPGRAAFLTRGEGSRRGILNPGLIGSVAAEFGIPRIDLVTINSLNTTAEHAALFSSFGLIISGHSSQLKNVAFAAPHTAVIELNGEHIADYRVSPFEDGVQHIDVHYVVSRHHYANWTACGTACKHPHPTLDRDAPLTLNATLLRDAFKRALAAQHAACPGVLYQ